MHLSTEYEEDSDKLKARQKCKIANITSLVHRKTSIFKLQDLRAVFLGEDFLVWHWFEVIGE